MTMTEDPIPMASDGKTKRTGGSRSSAARATAARPEDKKGKRRSKAKATKAKTTKGGKSPLDKQESKSRLMKIAVIVFAVIMALSMMLPSLASIFTSDSASDAASQADSTGSDAAATTTQTTSVATIDAAYSSEVEDLKARLEEDENDLAALLNLGNDYLQWAYTASMFASTDEETAHVDELYDLSIEYYDRYLALNDSNAAAVDRALALYYKGDVDGAIAYLEERSQGAGAEYGPVWANLGMMYESQGDTDAAESAYNKAMETDPDDEYGAYTYASERLASLNGTSTSSSMSSSGSLSDTLSSASGTSL
jgi:tetratricopeptide (TPR) repeat protein